MRKRLVTLTVLFMMPFAYSAYAAPQAPAAPIVLAASAISAVPVTPPPPSIDKEPAWYSTETGGHFQVETPSYLDVGVGIAHMTNANPQTQQESTGLLLTIKAYPCRRWYAAKKKPTLAQVQQSVATGQTATANQQMAQLLESSTKLYDVDFSSEHGICSVGNWAHHISVFYGRSVGSFDPPVVGSSLDAIGLQYDVAPEMALMIGDASYQVSLPNNTTDRRHHLIFGIQLNLHAFSLFRSLGDSLQGSQ